MTAPKPLVLDRQFKMWLGMFHMGWATADLLSSYGIGLFLKIPDEDTHILASGMEFGRKAMLLRNLVSRSDHPNRKEILAALNTLQNESKRNALVHGIISSGPDWVAFIERSRGGDYKVNAHKFTLPQFMAHVVKISQASLKLEQALGVDQARTAKFVAAAFLAETKSK